MSPSGSSAASPQPSSDGRSAEVERQEWTYRGAVGFVAVLLLWLFYYNQDNGTALLFLAPLIVGAVTVALRLPGVSNAVNSIENRLRAGSAKASGRQGKFARFFQRPFYGSCLAIWRWTRRISDVHLRAGVRVTALIFVCAIAFALLAMAAYIIVAIVVFMIVLAIIGWVLSLSGNSRPGTVRGVTRYTTDWIGRPKQEHFDNAGHKVAESKPETNWLGQTKLVTKDGAGNVIGESKLETDLLGRPKIVHKDAEGIVTGESKPRTDWVGKPKTVHTDPDGNATGESREETDLLGRRKTVHYEK